MGRVLTGLAAATVTVMLATSVMAASVTVEQPWARASVTANGAGYLTVVNSGSEAVRLVGAASPVTMRAGLHNHVMADGVMAMVQLDEVEVAAGGRVVFAPGGLHIMLMGLYQPLRQGETFDLTLRFAAHEPITVSVTILGVASMGPAGDN
jgi:copper(I)-binding protein